MTPARGVQTSARHADRVRTPKPCSLPLRPASRQTLLASGMTLSTIRTLVARDRLRVVRHGVYLATAAWPDDEPAVNVMLARAEAVANPRAVVSHASAALVWGLPTPGFAPWSDAPPAVTLPAEGHAACLRGSVVHHVGKLPSGHVAVDDDGYDVTTPARTAVDLAADLDLPESLVLLDVAARRLVTSFVSDPRRRHFSDPRLVEAARDHLSQIAQTRRIARLDRAISLAEACRESPAESLSAGHIHLSGLPVPLYQFEIRTSRGRLYPDFYWPDADLIGECDGAVKYKTADGFVSEKEREQYLRDLGHRMVRWQAREMMTRPQMVLDRIARALGY